MEWKARECYLKGMDEESFIKEICARLPQGPDVAVGPGDDCAVLDFGLEEFILAAADQVVSGVHYLEDTAPEKVGAKLMKRNISDIAAMGGVPTHALVTVALKPVDRKWLDAFHKGLRDCAAEYGVSIIGGDISALNAPGQACSLSILGRCRKDALCLRANAKEGDALFSTGFFGNSFASEKHLDFTPRLKEAKFLAGRFTRAMIDVSDGLLKDARRMAQASGLGLELDIERVARAPGSSLQAALSDGEDYELLLAVEAKRSEELERLWPFEGTVLTRLGSFVAAPPGTLRGIDGGTICESNCGFDHFHEKDAD